jgi:peptidyl-prolyl cis-trans isomerase B (cyclophilin B)
VPTNKQRREAERRRLQRQLQRRREREVQRRRFTLIASIVGTVVVIGIVIGFLVATNNDDKKPKQTAANSSTSPTSAPSTGASSSAAPVAATSGYCKFQNAPSTETGLTNVGTPADPKTPSRKDVKIEFVTNRGTIKATLDGKNAPCNTLAVSYLIKKKFYDNTPCPRVDDTGLHIVQCGSGGATTAGGPTFTSPDENLKNADYSPGEIAMANTGAAHTGSSQFFFITKDDNSALQKSYTPLGKVTSGLSILQKVAAGGNDGSSGSTGGGKPKLSLTFKQVKVLG